MISEEMLSLAGATREQMDAILIDLGYQKVDEKPAEDPEKPPLGIYARPERQPRRKPARGDEANGGKPARSGKSAKKSAMKSGQNGGRRHADRPRKQAEDRINPDSPFAILAQMKTGSSSKNG